MKWTFYVPTYRPIHASSQNVSVNGISDDPAHRIFSRSRGMESKRNCGCLRLSAERMVRAFWQDKYRFLDQIILIVIKFS